MLCYFIAMYASFQFNPAHVIDTQMGCTPAQWLILAMTFCCTGQKAGAAIPNQFVLIFNQDKVESVEQGIAS